MDLYQIRYFLTIAEVRSFTKAAEQLFVSQPSLSAGIKKLEQELEVTLFERGGRRVLLTPAGQLFQHKAQTILAEYQSVRQDLAQLKNQPRLRIATLHSIRSRNLAELMGAFREKYPNVSIEICNGYLAELQAWLEQGLVDLSITWLPEPEVSQTAQFLFHQPLSLAVPQDHAFAQATSVSLRDLDGQPYIKRLNCEFWRAHPKMFEDAGVKPRTVYASNNEEWVISLIQAGMGMSIMPVWADITQLAYVPLVDLSLSRSIGLRWRGHQDLEVVNWFRDFMLDYVWQVAAA